MLSSFNYNAPNIQINRYKHEIIEKYNTNTINLEKSVFRGIFVRKIILPFLKRAVLKEFILQTNHTQPTVSKAFI